MFGKLAENFSRNFRLGEKKCLTIFSRKQIRTNKKPSLRHDMKQYEVEREAPR